MTTSDENFKLVVSLYKQLHRKAGSVLFAKDIQAYAAEPSVDQEAVKSGLTYGYEQKWLEDGPNGTIKLTDAGFAQF